jgi:H+/Cl- antiporter ClcA
VSRLFPAWQQLTHSSRLWRARFAALAGAVLLGLVAIAFAHFGDMAQHQFLAIVKRWPWAPFLLTPALFVGVVWLTRVYWPQARGSGIPQVMAAAHAPESENAAKLLSPSVAVAKFLGTAAILLAGGSAGREGPTVQISAAIMMAVHRVLRVPISAGVVIAGGAAGVAAAFNTPLAGVAFAIEELASAFEQKVAVLVMMAVMVGGLISLGLSGDYVYFGAMNDSMTLAQMALGVPLAGITGGLAGGLFSRALVGLSASRRAPAQWMRAHPLVVAGLCGLVVAATGAGSEGISWGTGYDMTHDLLSGHAAPLMFGPAKFVSTLATALSGAPGGIFAPSLSVGAGLGQVLSLFTPGTPSATMVLLGLIGYFTGVVRAPLTAVIIVAEMTATRTMILPLFGTAIIADWVSAQVCPPKLYHALSRAFG